jgi:hypothetical protein
MSSRGHAGVLLAAVLALGVLAFAGAPAQAKQARLFTGTFGAGASVPANPYPLMNAEHVAVDDSTHDVYVTDTTGARVEKFNAKGEFLLMFGKGVNKTAVSEARPESEQNLCPAPGHPGDECRAGENHGLHSPLEEPLFVAVDNSPGGVSKGDVYVSNASAAGLIDKFDSSGHLVAGWATGGQLDASAVKHPPAPVEGPFGAIVGIAVDTSGNLWINTYNNNTFEFRQDASLVTGWRFGGDEFSLDSEDNLYSVGQGLGSPGVFKYDSAGHLIGSVFLGETVGKGIVVDPSNNIYIGQTIGGSEFFVQRYDSSCHPTINAEGGLGPPCTPVEAFGSSVLRFFNGLAVDPSTPAEPLYVGESGPSEVAVFAVEAVPDVSALTPSSLTSSSATLQGSVNPSGVALSECFFEWGEATSYGHKAKCEAPGAGEIPADSNTHNVHAAITGLQAGRIYHYRLVAANANDVNALIDEPSRSADFAFGPPAIEDESVLGVTATSATLQTVLNPNNIDTTFHFEYGTQAGVYGQFSPETDVGSGGTAQSLPVHLQGLLPGTVYHYRVIATNSLGTSEGKDQTFTTQVAGVFSLLDGRGWELVSPPDKHGALIAPLQEGRVMQASADGGAVTYLASAPTEAQAPGNSKYTQVLSTRVDGSWGSRDIATPRDIASGFDLSAEEYKFFSSDLSLAVVEPVGVFLPSLSSEASEQTPYLRTDYTGGSREDPCASSCYRPLVTGAPGFANVPEGIEFGEPSRCRRAPCGPSFLGASPDGTHVVLTAEAALTEGVPARSLYEWANGQLGLVSVLPEGTPAPTSSSPGLGHGGVRGSAVSADGSRVVWSTGVDPQTRLYVRDMPREETVELSGLGAVFEAAAVDGSRILFTVKGELYVFEAPLGVALSAGHTTDLTPGGGVLGEVLGVSRDGSSVYFVATTVLTSTSSPHGETAQAGQPNLYAYYAGTIKLVAVLSNEGSRLGRVSPSGRWVAFMSARPLTGYDNRDVSSGVRDEEVFLYDATGNSGEGTLVCASCNPTGARPHGVLDQGERLVDGQSQSRGWLAANIPGWTSSLYQSRYLSDSGRLFFNSSDALVPSDTNGMEDVYEYEPPGLGSCTSQSATFNARSGGCVDLISSGSSKEESAFLDASESGDDVFFLTSAQLAKQDRDTIFDVYDARVGGGLSTPQPPPACEGDACQSPVAAPNDPTPGSLTYRGPGNPVPLLAVSKTTTKKVPKCTKGKRLSHGKCTKSKSERGKRARKASGTGRATGTSGAGSQRGGKS